MDDDISSLKGIIILDFDNTLFDSKSFYERIFDQIKDQGISRELFDLTYNQVKSQTHYYPHLHVKRISKIMPFDVSKVLVRLKNIWSFCPGCLYSDSISFLEKMSDSGYDLVLNTYGDEIYQSKKVKFSGVSKHFKELIFSKNIEKKQKISDYLNLYKNVYFIDDNQKTIEGIKKDFNQVKTCLLDRRDKYKLKGQKKEVYRTLEELESFIK